MVQNPRITEAGKCSGIIKSTLGLIPTLAPTQSMGTTSRWAHKAGQGLSRFLPEEAMLGEAGLPHLNLSFKVPNWPVLTTKPTQHEPFQAELWDVTVCSQHTTPLCRISLNHHCVLKHVLTSNTPRKTQEFYSVKRSQHRRVTTLIFTDRKWKMAQTQLFASLKEHPKTFRDKGI